MTIERIKFCNKCKIEKYASEFYHRKSAKDGLFTICKACTDDYNNQESVKRKRLIADKKYRQRADVKRARRKRVALYRDANIDKFRARELFQKRVQRGAITRLPCQFCCAPSTAGHHHDYSKPLVIVWVCDSCHNRIHAGAIGQDLVIERMINYEKHSTSTNLESRDKAICL